MKSLKIFSNMLERLKKRCNNKESSKVQNGQKTPLELAFEYKLEREQKYAEIDLYGKFRKSAQEITEILGGNEKDSMSLYDFIESFYEAYSAYRKEYEDLGVLNLGKSTTLGFREYVEEDNYRFFCAAVLPDRALDRYGITKTTDMIVPNRSYKYIAITEKDGKVTGEFLKGRSAESPSCAINLDAKTLKSYLDLFGKYHKLFELSPGEGLVVKDPEDNAKIHFDFSTHFSSIEGIFSVTIWIYFGDYRLDVNIAFNGDLPYYSNYSIYYENDYVDDFIPFEFMDEMLKSIKVSRSHLMNYKGKAEKNLIKYNSYF